MPRKTKQVKKPRRVKRSGRRPPMVGVARNVTLPAAQQKIVGAKGHIRVTHRELFVSQTTAPTAPSLITRDISPTSSALFPWLSQMATLYQCYHWNKLTFRYVPACASTTAGTVFAYIDYNVHDQAPLAYSTLAQNMGFLERSAWQDLSVSLDRKQQLVSDRLYTGAPPSGADSSWYRSGNLVTGTTSTAGTTTTLGRWYVEYDVTLFTPQSPDSSTETNVATSFEFAPTSASATNLYGTGTAQPIGGDAGIIDAGALHINQSGDYFLDLCVNGAGMSTNNPVPTVTNAGTMSITDMIVQDAGRSLSKWLLTGAIAGLTKIAWSKVGASAITHVDTTLAPASATALLQAQTIRRRDAEQEQKLAERVAAFILREEEKSF